MSLTDDARAEAEKRYRGPRMHVGTVVDREVSAYTRGYLAGHEAASRSREITLDQVIEAISGACISDVSAYTAAERVVALYDNTKEAQ